MKLINVVGARQNFMKIAPIVRALNDYNRDKIKDDLSRIEYLLIHTGQHYSKEMYQLFFHDLNIPTPDVNLEVGSGSHAVQTAEIMKRFEQICLKHDPTHVLVVGDVNSTIGCALVASKLGIKVIHVEAGLRSFDRNMPEEINRILTDAISDLLFTTDEVANQNLQREGITSDKIHLVGNVMIDTLLQNRQKAKRSDILNALGLNGNKDVMQEKSQDTTEMMSRIEKTISFALLTLHRPSNVDDRSGFEEIIQAIHVVSTKLPVIFPVHPRTSERIKLYGFEDYFKQILDPGQKFNSGCGGIYCIKPVGYLDFLNLMSHARLVLTDSGGIQEETTILRIPCVTIRENTERSITITKGTNILAGTKKENIVESALSQLSDASAKRFAIDEFSRDRPPSWDGQASRRIINVLAKEVIKGQ